MTNMSEKIDVAACLPLSVAESVRRAGLLPAPAGASDIADVLVSHEGLRRDEIFEYVAYLKLMLEVSLATAELFDLRSPPGSSGKKEHLRHTGPEDVMHIINYLYVLDSYGVPGGLLECGTSHGYSTCCLSHACARLGRVLYTADSFEGLPPTAPDEPFFRKGDYAAPLENVQRNIRAAGRPESVQYVKGWFSESLKDWAHDIALLWIDVDLYDSARDVITCTLPKLARKGGIVLHEFTDFHNRIPPRNAARPPNAVYDVLEANNMRWRSVHLHRYLGAVLLENSVAPDSFRLLPALLVRLSAMDGRSRAYKELRESRTVQLAFKVKRALTGK